MPETGGSDRDCPARGGREKRAADLLCRRCWYILPNDLKQAYHDARRAVNVSKSRGAIDALKDARQNILDSATPKGNSS